MAPITYLMLILVWLVCPLAACQALKTPESAPTLPISPTSLPTQPALTPTLTASLPPTVELAQPHPLLGDLRLRQGIAYCTDKKALFSELYPWIADPSSIYEQIGLAITLP